MRSTFVLLVLLASVSATASLAEGAIGSPMESCEKGAIVKDGLGATGRIISEMAGMCLVTFPDGTEGVSPGGGNMHPPGALIRQAALTETRETGVVAGSYLCTPGGELIQYYFELAEDGTYTLQESAGTYENPDQNSINFRDGELDGASGWMNKGVIGLTVPGVAREARCVVQ